METYVSRVEHTGEGDLVQFRDAVLTYCAALRAKQPFHVSAPEEARELLRWMNVKFEEGTGPGRTFLDPGRAGQNGKCVTLASADTLPRTPLASFRDRGLLGTTLFAALVRSSYGPDEPGFFPTQSELGFYFEEEKLLPRQARWDEAYLRECQDFFFEELTPMELLESAYSRLPEAARNAGEPFREALEGVAFLIGEETTTLEPLTRFFQRLLLPEGPLPELRRLLQSVEEWEDQALRQEWEKLDSERAEAIRKELFATVPVEPVTLMHACGRSLLEWRAGA